MESRTKAVLSFTILVMVIIVLYIFTNWFSLITGYVLGEDEKIALAQCLGGKEAVLYTSATCPACEEQFALFGETALGFIDVFECRSLEGACADLTGVPAWEIHGRIHYGVKDLDRLIEISGCEVVR